MRITGTSLTAAVFILLAAAGCGAWLWRGAQENRRLELQAKVQHDKLAAKAEDARKAEAEKAAADGKARQAEAAAKRAEAEKAAAADNLAAKKKDQETQQTRLAAEKAAAEKAVRQREAAEAETRRLEAEKAASDARQTELAKKSELEAKALERARAEAEKANSEAARTADLKRIAEAALAKSENEKKAAEANAAAEHDRKLRMYKRAATSRAEMLELQRAERRLALEEAGMPVDDEAVPAAAADAAPAAGEDGVAAPAAEPKVDVAWIEEVEAVAKGDSDLAAAKGSLDGMVADAVRRRESSCVEVFGGLMSRARAEGRDDDAEYYRRTLILLAPDYEDIYIARSAAARAAGNEKQEAALIRELASVVDRSARESLFVRLVKRDGEHYPAVLTSVATKSEYVGVFKKLIDDTRRNGNLDLDDRDAQVERHLRTLARFVPDFESLEEWKR